LDWEALARGYCCIDGQKTDTMMEMDTNYLRPEKDRQRSEDGIWESHIQFRVQSSNLAPGVEAETDLK
jgi:hypothetical protein